MKVNLQRFRINKFQAINIAVDKVFQSKQNGSFVFSVKIIYDRKV